MKLLSIIMNRCLKKKKKSVRLKNLCSWHASSICEKRLFSMNKHVWL